MKLIKLSNSELFVKVDEFEKLIDDAEREGEVFWGNGQDKLRQKLKEFKKWKA